MTGRAGIRAFGVTGLYVYGSAARDSLSAESDVDLFADVDYDRFGFVSFMNLREFLKDLLNRKVDFTTRNALHADLKEGIVRSAIPVFDEAADPVAAWRASSAACSVSARANVTCAIASPTMSRNERNTGANASARMRCRSGRSAEQNGRIWRFDTGSISRPS